MRFLGAAVLCLTAVFSDGQLVENLLRTGLRYDSRDTSSLSYEAILERILHVERPEWSCKRRCEMPKVAPLKGNQQTGRKKRHVDLNENYEDDKIDDSQSSYPLRFGTDEEKSSTEYPSIGRRHENCAEHAEHKAEESKHLLLPELLLPEPIPTITSIKHQHSYESSTKEPKPTTEAGTAKHRTRRPIPTVPSDLNGHIVGGHIIKSIDRDEQEKENDGLGLSAISVDDYGTSHQTPERTVSELLHCHCDNICQQTGDCCVDFDEHCEPRQVMNKMETSCMHQRFVTGNKALWRRVNAVSDSFAYPCNEHSHPLMGCDKMGDYVFELDSCEGIKHTLILFPIHFSCTPNVLEELSERGLQVPTKAFLFQRCTMAYSVPGQCTKAVDRHLNCNNDVSMCLKPETEANATTKQLCAKYHDPITAEIPLRLVNTTPTTADGDETIQVQMSNIHCLDCLYPSKEYTHITWEEYIEPKESAKWFPFRTDFIINELEQVVDNRGKAKSGARGSSIERSLHNSAAQMNRIQLCAVLSTTLCCFVVKLGLYP